MYIGFVTQEEASFVLEIFGEKISEADMNKLMAQSGKIFLADFLEFIANKVKAFCYFDI